MIAGYFAPGSYDRKGMGPFLKDRLLRLGVPVLFYIFVIHPLLSYALAVTVRGFVGSFWEYYVRHVRGYSQYGLGVGPMWFTAVLLIFTIIYGLWRLAWRQTGRLAKPTANPPQSDSKTPGNVAIAVFALLLGLVTWVVRFWYPIDRWVTILLVPVEIAHLPQYIILLAKAMSASAYTVYIIHQPVLIFLGLVLSGFRLPHLLKFALVAPVAVALCFLLSNYIRKLPLARSIL